MMFFQRDEYEERQYPTLGRHLRGHKAAFEQAGYAVSVVPAGPGVYLLIVNLPTWMPAEVDPYQLPRRRRRSWGRYFDWRNLAALAAVLLVVAAGGYSIYSAIPADPTPGEVAPEFAPPEPSWWERLPELPTLPALPELRLPWEDDKPVAPIVNAPGEPVIERTDGGWQWPWEGMQNPLAEAQRAIDDTVEGIKTVALATTVLVVLGIVLLVVLKVGVR